VADVADVADSATSKAGKRKAAADLLRAFGGDPGFLGTDPDADPQTDSPYPLFTDDMLYRDENP